MSRQTILEIFLRGALVWAIAAAPLHAVEVAEAADGPAGAGAAARELAARGTVVAPQWHGFPVRLPRVVISTDMRIGDPAISYKDPEYLIDERLVTWQDGLNQIWLCRFDPRTGDMMPPDGRGLLLAQGAAPLLPADDPFVKTTINGPEFGVSRRGIGVYFCYGSDPANYQVARVGLSDLAFEVLVPGLTNGTRGALATLNRRDPIGRVLHGRLQTLPDGTVGVVAEWFEEDDPESVQPFPRSTFGSSGPHWIPGERAIASNLFDEAGIPQVVRFDIDSGRTTFLTSGPYPKVDTIFFEPPEFPGEQLFLCLVNDGQFIGVYRRQGLLWTCIQRIFAPDAFRYETPPTVSSAEPVFYRGRTYFTFAVGYDDNSSRIALASLDGEINALISVPGPLRQIDPEGVAVGDLLFVTYWTAANAERVNELHRCTVQILR